MHVHSVYDSLIVHVHINIEDLQLQICISAFKLIMIKKNRIHITQYTSCTLNQWHHSVNVHCISTHIHTFYNKWKKKSIPLFFDRCKSEVLHFLFIDLSGLCVYMRNAYNVLHQAFINVNLLNWFLSELFAFFCVGILQWM